MMTAHPRCSEPALGERHDLWSVNTDQEVPRDVQDRGAARSELEDCWRSCPNACSPAGSRGIRRWRKPWAAPRAARSDAGTGLEGRTARGPHLDLCQYLPGYRVSADGAL